MLCALAFVRWRGHVLLRRLKRLSAVNGLRRLKVRRIETVPDQPMILSGRGVTAVLGPTNTGKTHYAIERMVAHASGVIGLPLRLLAREVYTRARRKGRRRTMSR